MDEKGTKWSPSYVEEDWKWALAPATSDVSVTQKNCHAFVVEEEQTRTPVEGCVDPFAVSEINISMVGLGRWWIKRVLRGRGDEDRGRSGNCFAHVSSPDGEGPEPDAAV